MKLPHLEDSLVLGSLVLVMAGITTGAVLAEPRAFGITAFIVIGILLLGGMLTRSPRLSWLLLFGLVAGILELWSDWVHVEYFGTLVYTDYFGYPLLASPLYMPVGWWLTSVQFGYIALRLGERFSKWKAVVLVTLLGMSLPPWYEEFAAPARAWYYNPARVMLSNTPLWIIFTYGGCMFGIAVMTLLCYNPGKWKKAVIGGIFTGAGFMLSGVFWFSIFG
ncbi:MAG: hypothetical protein PVF58_11095 [Candidatus Methanofastidiosia archaeon]